LLGNGHDRLAAVLQAAGLAREIHHRWAVDAFTLAERLSPEDPSPRYARACAHAIWGDVEEALCALQQAVALGLHDAAWAAEDPDFACLRLLPEFQHILSLMREESGPH
jgi:Flp pilus assembly protein TadD